MGKYSAAGVIREEKDLSEIVAPVGTSIGATVGEAIQGIANARILLSNDKNYIDKFGEPDSVNLDYSGYAAIEFLRESDSLYYVRATEGDETYANMCFDSTGELSATDITADDSTTLVARSGFEDGNKADNIYEIENAVVAGAALSGSFFVVSSIGPGVYGENIGIKVITTTDAVSAGYDWADFYESATAAKVFKIEVFIKDTNDVTFPSTPEEEWYVAREEIQDSAGKQLFSESVINGNSAHIYIKDLAAATTYPGSTNEVVIALDDGADTAGAVSNAKKQSAWSLFAETERVSVSILIAAVDPATANAAALQTFVGGLCASRLDCIAVAQADQVTDTNEVTIATGTNYTYTNPSYVALYAGWDKLYDIYNDKLIFVPKCIFGAAIMARTDRVANTWDAPAGINRGIIPSLGQNHVFNKSQIGYLYDRNINTSKSVNGIGNVMWGQKTAQKKRSALDRINVRRLLLYIENSVEPALLPFLFEANTDKTRLRVSSIVDSFMRTVEAGGGVEKYDVVCDTSNNTSQVIDNNRLYLDIYVQPTKTIEFIRLQTIVTRTGVSFEEIR